jgi:hypothetical protein
MYSTRKHVDGAGQDSIPQSYVFQLYISILYFSKMASVLCCVVKYRRPNGWAYRDQNWQKYSLGLCDEDMGWGRRSAPRARSKQSGSRSRCVVLCCPVRYMRPNGWADQNQHWHKYSLVPCDEDREDTLMEQGGEAAASARSAAQRKKRKKCVISDRHMC